MQFYSLHKTAPAVSFRTAAISGQAPDKGLYFPEYIPRLDQGLIDNIETLANEEIAFRVIHPYVGNDIDEASLYRIVSETIQFPFPLVPVTEKISSLELFHGPTLAFKDVGARFMSRCLSYFIQKDPGAFSKKVTVLVATSGDTGGAVANGFDNVPGIEVVILYPSKRVSEVQEKQLTANGANIHALEVNGSFDDCQRMVKQAFVNERLNQHLYLTSANSINVARWLPQQFYYFFAYKQWGNKNNPPVISVPSGNFGNICAGLLAKASGLPVEHFIAACNANDVIPGFMQTGEYHPQPAHATLSNAMDVGDPSNFVRVMELFDQQLNLVKENVTAYSIDDATTVQTLTDVYNATGYLLEPHGAVGYTALEKYLENHPGKKGIVLETAHPVKFPAVINEVLPGALQVPASVAALMKKTSRQTVIQPDFSQLEDFLLSI